MAGRQQVSGGFRRDGRSNAWGVGQVDRNAATHLAGKLEIEFADLFLLVSKEMRRRQKHRCRARTLRPSRQAERVVQPNGPSARVQRNAAALDPQIQQTATLFQTEGGGLAGRRRSEEDTSELQSPC